MGNIPTNNRQPESAQTGSTGAYASAASFGSFSDYQANKIQDTLNGITDVMDRQQAHRGAVAANDAVTNLQETWIDKLPDYKDPAQFQKDYLADQNQTANDLASNQGGFAKDTFIEASNHFGIRAYRQVVRQQRKGQVDDSVNAVGASLDNVSTISSWLGGVPAGAMVSPDGSTASSNVDGAPVPPATGASSAPAGSPDQNTPDAVKSGLPGLPTGGDETPASAAPAGISPAGIPASDQPIVDPHAEIDKIVATAVGGNGVAPVVPPNMTIAMGDAAHQTVDRNLIGSTVATQGYGSAVAQVANGTLGNYLAPEEKDSTLNDLVLNNMANRGARQMGAKLALKNMTDTIAATGQIPTPQAQQSLITAYAQNLSDVEGKNVDKLMIEAKQAIETARSSIVIKSTMMGMNPTDRQAYIDSLQGKDLATAQGWQTQFKRQQNSDPMTFAMNSPAYRQAFDTAQGTLNQNPQDPGAIKSFNAVLEQGLNIQRAGGVPESGLAVMSAATASTLASQISSNDQDSAHKALGSILSTYGSNTQTAMRNLTTLPPEGQRLDSKFSLPLANYNTPLESALLQAFQEDRKGGLDSILKLDNDPNNENKIKWNTALESSFSPFAEAMTASGTPSQAVEISKGVLSYAKYIAAYQKGVTPKEATDRAYQAVISSKYGTGAMNGKTFLVPAQDSNGQPYTPDETESMSQALPAALTTLSMGKPVGSAVPSVGAFMNKPDAQVVADDSTTFQNAVSQRGFPVLADNGNYRIAVDQGGQPYTYTGSLLQKLGFAAGKQPPVMPNTFLRGKDGKPLELSPSDLLNFHKQLRAQADAYQNIEL